MPRLTHPLAEWIAVARELDAPGRITSPPGLLDRIRALVAHAPSGWPEQVYALELDDAGAEAVAATHAALTGRDPGIWQRSASVAEADAIVREHQQRA